MAQQHEQSPLAQPVRSLTATSDQRGFTLVEVIVAMLVSTVGLMAMAQMLAVTLRMQQLGRNSAIAVRMAQDKIDDLTNRNFATDAQVACGGSLTADVANYNDIPLLNGADQGYRRRWQIGTSPDGDAQLRTVTVRVIPIVNDRNTSAQIDLVSVLQGAAGVVACP